MNRLSMEQDKMVDKCGSVVTRFVLDKMLKMVKTMLGEDDGEDDDGDRFDDSQI